MRKFFFQDSLSSHVLLERKLSLSALTFVGAGPASHGVPVMFRPLDDDPPPDPEPDPPPDPPIPPSGPSGPG